MDKPLYDRTGRRILNSIRTVGRPMSWVGSNGNTSSYKVGNKTFHPQVLRNNGDWRRIEEYLKTCPDVRCAVCFKCGASAGYLYDKNDNKYQISRSLTLKEVEILVEEIRKINNS